MFSLNRFAEPIKSSVLKEILLQVCRSLIHQISILQKPTLSCPVSGRFGFWSCEELPEGADRSYFQLLPAPIHYMNPLHDTMYVWLLWNYRAITNKSEKLWSQRLPATPANLQLCGIWRSDWVLKPFLLCSTLHGISKIALCHSSSHRCFSASAGCLHLKCLFTLFLSFVTSSLQISRSSKTEELAVTANKLLNSQFSSMYFPFLDLKSTARRTRDSIHAHHRYCKITG